jgi:hypothetical protein
VALVVIPGNTATAGERPAESSGEKIQPSPASTPDREEIDREKKANEFMAAQQKASQQKGKAGASASPVSKPSHKASSHPPVSAGEATPHAYAGFIGDASINLTMTVYKGKVSGDFYFLREPSTLYTFSGRNAKEGLLTFIVNSGGVPFAEAELKKDPRIKNSVLWDGTLKALNKQSLRFFLNRPLKPEGVAAWPASVDEFEQLKGFERYEGSVTDARGAKATAVFRLKFNGIKCDGFYYQVYPNGRTSFIFRLEGQNPQGLLTLREFDDEGMSAELYLKKTMTGNLVSWHGEMTNHRFNQLVKKVEFHHTLKP